MTIPKPDQSPPVFMTVNYYCDPFPSISIPPFLQAAFRSDIGALLEQVGVGKESLSFMKRRMRRLAAQWASAARRLDDRLRSHWREQKRVSMGRSPRHSLTHWRMNVYDVRKNQFTVVEKTHTWINEVLAIVCKSKT